MTQEVRGTTGVVRFEVPDQWVVEENLRPGLDAVAYLPGAEGAFAPNVVVTVNDFGGTSAELAASAVSGIGESLTDPYVFDIRVWEPGGEAGDTLAADGRAVSYTHRTAGTGVRVRATEWLLAVGGKAVQVTTTCGVGDWPVLGPLLASIAGTLVVEADGESDLTIPDSARDQLVSDAVGQEVERISGLAELQPYPYTGLFLHGSAVDLFSELAEGATGEMLGESMAEQFAELEAVGLVSGTELSEQGEAIAQFLVDPDASIRLSGTYGDHEPTFQAWVMGPLVLVVAGTGYTAAAYADAARPPSHDHFDVSIQAVGELSTLMAEWVGLQPAWNLPVHPATLAEDVLERRWRGDGEFPQNADARLQALWHENWFAWELLAVGRSTEVGPVAYLNGGKLGHFRTGADPDGAGVILLPTPSLTIFDQFEDAIQACVFQREARVH